MNPRLLLGSKLLSEACSNVVNVKPFSSRFKVGFVAIAVLLSSLGFASPAHAKTYKCSKGGSFKVSKGVLFDGKGCKGKAKIPNGVKQIGEDSFYHNYKIEVVEIPASVTIIGDFAFAGTTVLTSFAVSSKNKKFRSKKGVLFDKNSTQLLTYPAGKNLTSYTVPSGVKNVGDCAFCYSLAKRISLPAGLNGIGMSAFYGTSLTSIIIPASVTSVGPLAFYGTSLTSITIPASVTFIGKDAFSTSTYFGVGAVTETRVGIKSITVSPGNQKYSSLGGVLFNKNATALIKYPPGKSETSYSIPVGVTSVESAAFTNTMALTSISIPSSVTRIRESAFSGCEQLHEVEFLGNAPTVGPDAFEGLPWGAYAVVGATATGFGLDEKWNGLRIEVLEL